MSLMNQYLNAVASKQYATAALIADQLADTAGSQWYAEGDRCRAMLAQQTETALPTMTRKQLIERGAVRVFRPAGAGFSDGLEIEAGLMLDGALYVAPKNEYGHSAYLGDVWNPDYEVFETRS